MAFLTPLPSIIKESKRIVLLPQLSLRDRLIKEKGKYFSSGPKLFDSFVPLIGKNSEVIITPFLGHVGICTVLDQILLQNTNNPEVYFFGTCGGITDEGINLGDILQPKNYFIEESLDCIHPISIGEPGPSIISTAFLMNESVDKFFNLNLSHKISLIDMELSFIFRITEKHKIKLNPTMIVTDLWSGSAPAPCPKTPSTLTSYPDYLNILLNLIP